MDKLSFSGLTSRQVLENQKKYGFNQLEKKRKIGPLVSLFKKLANPLIVILIFSSLLSAFLGQATDFYIILVILFISVLLDTFQEHQAEKSAQMLSQKIALTATVIRNRQLETISTSLVTIDDLLQLQAGNLIPADCRVLSSQDLLVNQAALTGESYPQSKKPGDHLFMATYVLSGFATAQVTAIGKNTEIGKISSRLNVTRPPTDFERGLNKFALLLVRLTFVLSLLLLIVNLILGHNFISSLMFILALAIGFAPELLPMILTINLSKGALKLSRHGVIVKFLPSIENFGSMDILCTDKTGTLTQGQTTLESCLNTKGQPDNSILRFAAINSHFQSGFSNPLDQAILSKSAVIHGVKKLAEIPYDFYRKRVSVVVKDGSDYYLITKGSPQSVLAVSGNHLQFDLNHFERLGLRLLAVAVKKIKNPDINFSVHDENGLTCLGILAFSDPPKFGVAPVLKQLEDNGVTLKILTGDSEQITQYICQTLDVPVIGSITGDRLAKLSDIELLSVVEKHTIFARLDPDTKLKIILALKHNGHVVGYLGDGINDAPALKAADVGISVNNAVDVAKESADLILLHKDLKVLLLGLREGRTTFANIMKYIMMGTSSTFGNMISLALASCFLPFLPMLPVQVLLNDLFYDISQILLVKDNVDPGVIEKPQHWDIKFIRKFTFVFGAGSSLFDMLTFYILLTVLKATPAVFQTGWFLESLISQMVIIFSIRTALVPFYKSHINPVFAAGLVVIIILVFLLPFSFLAPYLHLSLPPAGFYLLLVLLILNYFYLIEMIKSRFYKPRF